MLEDTCETDTKRSKMKYMASLCRLDILKTACLDIFLANPRDCMHLNVYLQQEPGCELAGNFQILTPASVLF